MTVMMIEHDAGVVMDIPPRRVLDFVKIAENVQPRCWRSPIKRPYLGEGTKSWSIPTCATSCRLLRVDGMMDCARRVAQANATIEAAAWPAPRVWHGAIALRRHSGSGVVQLGRLSDPRCMICAYQDGRTRARPRRRDRHHRRPAGRIGSRRNRHTHAIGAMYSVYRDVLDEETPIYEATAASWSSPDEEQVDNC